MSTTASIFVNLELFQKNEHHSFHFLNLQLFQMKDIWNKYLVSLTFFLSWIHALGFKEKANEKFRDELNDASGDRPQKYSAKVIFCKTSR